MSSPTTDQQLNTDSTWELVKGDHVVLQYSELWRGGSPNLPKRRLVVVTKVVELGRQYYSIDVRTGITHYIDVENYVQWGCTFRTPTLKEVRNPEKFK